MSPTRAGAEESNSAVESQRALVARVASKGKSSVRQAKGDAAVADAQPVDHVLAHYQGELGVAGAHLHDLHAQILGVFVQTEHLTGDSLGEIEVFTGGFVFQELSLLRVDVV